MEASEEIIPSFPLGSRGGERKSDADQRIIQQNLSGDLVTPA